MGFFDFFKNKSTNNSKTDFDSTVQSLQLSDLAIDMYNKRDFNKSILYLSQAIDIDSDNPMLFIMRGTVYEDLSDDSLAKLDFDKAYKFSPDNYLVLYRLGMFYFRKQNFHEAVKYLKLSYKNCVEFNGLGSNNLLYVEKKIICANLGNFLIQLNQIEEAFRYLDEAIALDKNYPNPYMSKGMALIQLGAHNEGIQHLKIAANLGNPQARMALSMFGF